MAARLALAALLLPEAFLAAEVDVCPGRLAKNASGVLDLCANSTDYPGAYVKSTCDGTTLVSSIYTAPGCSGEGWATPFKLGECVHGALGSNGLTMLASCGGGRWTLRGYTLAPAPPSRVTCGAEGNGGLRVSAVLNASECDEAAFEVRVAGGAFFATALAAAQADGRASAVIEGLKPGLSYEIFARAHRKNEQEGNPDTWSHLASASATCVGPAAAAEVPAPQLRRAAGSAPRTRWIEVYRYVALGTLPDFLDQHNAGDLFGEAPMISQQQPNASQRKTSPPLTRYCVELEDTLLREVVTGDPNGAPRDAPFADFTSCNAGDCRCMHQVDRMIARLPEEQMKALCSNKPQDRVNNTCVCSDLSNQQSARHIGRAVIPLPFTFYVDAHPPYVMPPSYPGEYAPAPEGSWYSFPGAGRCAPGAAVGAGGCTWRLEPRAETVALGDLVEAGLAMVIANATKAFVPLNITLHNAWVIENVFDSLPLQKRTCGGDRASASRSEPLFLQI